MVDAFFFGWARLCFRCIAVARNDPRIFGFVAERRHADSKELFRNCYSIIGRYFSATYQNLAVGGQAARSTGVCPGRHNLLPPTNELHVFSVHNSQKCSSSDSGGAFTAPRKSVQGLLRRDHGRKRSEELSPVVRTAGRSF